MKGLAPSCTEVVQAHLCSYFYRRDIAGSPGPICSLPSSGQRSWLPPLVEAGYDRNIPPWEPTPARLIPTLDPAKVVTDLAEAVGEGANNAVALVNNPSKLIPTIPPPIVANVATLVSMLQTLVARQTPTTTVSPIEPAAGGLPSSTPAPVTLAPLAPQTVATGISAPVTSSSMSTQTQQVTSAAAAVGSRQASTVTTTSATVTGTDQTAAAQSATDTEQPLSPKVSGNSKATSAAASAVEPSTRPTSEASAARETRMPFPSRPFRRPRWRGIKTSL